MQYYPLGSMCDFWNSSSFSSAQKSEGMCIDSTLKAEK